MTAVPAHGTTHIAPSLCRVVALLSAVCWCWVLRMASDMPDLSHLTPEEREIIESVVHRQKQEEQKEQEIMRRKQEEVIMLEEKIRQRSEQQKKAGVELDATCHICLKTKFADGVGHLCNYCGIRCCARCGGKVTLRSSKVIWVCILCRKKQELLSKSGEWINHGMAIGSSGDSSRRSEVSSPCMMVMSDKRPKLERAHSAAEKENVLQRSNSLLRRQYSQQEPSSRKDQEHGVPGSHDEYYRTGRDDYYRGGEGAHRTGPNQQSSRSSHHHQFGPAADGGDGKPLQQTSNRGGPGTNLVRKYKRPVTGPLVQPPDRHHPHLQQHPVNYSSSEEEVRSTSECTSCDEPESEKGLYDLRKDKPYVMVTSPGSPEHLASLASNTRILRASKSVTGPNSSHVGGKIQVKLCFDSQSLKLAVTIMAASNLLPRSDGTPRSAYAKVCLLPDTSEKSKRRTKTIVNSTDPKWNQPFSFTTMRKSDLKLKVLQISVWDYDHNPTNQFLGEVLIELGLKKLDNLAEWYSLTVHKELTGEGGVQIGDYDTEYSGEHLSPPSTLSRQSDSDASDVDDCCSGRRIGADGASISSLGSSISPPPDYDHLDRRKSRRDMPPSQKSYVYGTTIEKKYVYDASSKQQPVPSRSTTSISHRSRSAAPTTSPSQHSRSRSKSPTMVTDRRSLSPPDYRYPGSVSSYRQVPSRMLARSATATPTSTPKKRQLPQIPGTTPSSLDDRIPYYFDDQTSSVRRRTRQLQPRRMPSRTSTSFSRFHNYCATSDSDIPLQQNRSLTPPHVRNSIMSRGETGDTCDIDDSDSVISSALSTQSEQPRPTRFSDYGASQSRSGSQQSPVMVPTTDSKRPQFSRSLSNADVQAENIADTGSSGKRRVDSSSITENTGKSSASGTNSSSSGMGKKSASASQLSATEGRSSKGKRGSGSGGGGAQPNFKRSQEVAPGRQASLTSLSSDCPSSAGQSTEGEVATFIGKLGSGQKVSRQILGTPYRGDVKIGFNFYVNFMEVIVHEAKDLIKETKTKIPDTYVKVYLVKGKKCVEKHRTKTIKENLQPKYNEMLKFKSSPAGCLIQVSVWGDYGREKGRKVFMGVAVIYMDNISTSPGSTLTEWYRLFGSSSL
ncbi:Hypothetical protein CINCED_3A025389 [Cinara cedri]|uniref:Regulating synaptic membrane exocytosis protein 2 n=1 Tax=Cinara cedri TaxID=506608 RepID=A0A5E4MFD1_9HEMI|nr:Hypothetical protein CINCED_3A025389 [Cinara cedri]